MKQQKDGIFISQEKYAKNLVKRFGLDSKKHTSTPMSSSAKLSLDAAGVEVDLTLYRSMIGSLLYLIASRPDIAFSVGVCARFQATPKESHLKQKPFLCEPFQLKGRKEKKTWNPSGFCMTK